MVFTAEGSNSDELKSVRLYDKHAESDLELGNYPGVYLKTGKDWEIVSRI